MLAGNLRDIRPADKRAHIFIVNKWKTDLSKEEKNDIIAELNPEAHQTVYFSETVYGRPYHLFTKEPGNLDAGIPALLVTGIAKTM